MSELTNNQINIYNANFSMKKHKTRIFKHYLSKKCSSICLTMRNLNYVDCVDNCYYKLIKSDELMENTIKHINLKYQ